jgi:hypothetical protein
MEEVDHDKVHATGNHAHPCQGSPVVDAVPQAEDNERANT